MFLEPGSRFSGSTGPLGPGHHAGFCLEFTRITLPFMKWDHPSPGCPSRAVRTREEIHGANQQCAQGLHATVWASWDLQTAVTPACEGATPLHTSSLLSHFLLGLTSGTPSNPGSNFFTGDQSQPREGHVPPLCSNVSFLSDVLARTACQRF